MIRPVGAVVPVPAPTPRLPGGPALVPLGEITCLERVVGLLQQCGNPNALYFFARQAHFCCCTNSIIGDLLAM